MAIEYKTVTYRTVERANDNATYCWVELSAAHVPAVNGLIKRIVIQGATTLATGMTTDPLYLGIWERQDDGGLISLGCSKNAVVQATNQQSVWDFDGAIIRGKSLLLGLLSSPDEHWTNNTQLLLRSRVQTSDTDGCVILTNIGRLKVTPDITFTVDVPEVIPDEEPEPEPEPESYSRTVDISKYWIPRIRETAEFQQIANALNPEFNRLIECQNRVLKDGFILEATEYGVSRWEAILHLAVTAEMTLDERKKQILNRLSLKLPYTVRILRAMLTEILGEGNFNFKIDNDTQTLTMYYASTVTDIQIANVDSLLERVLPMNLVVEVDQGLPIDYTPVKYLESTGTQYLTCSAIEVSEKDTVSLEWLLVDYIYTSANAIFCSLDTSDERLFRLYTFKKDGTAPNTRPLAYARGAGRSKEPFIVKYNETQQTSLSSERVVVNGVARGYSQSTEGFFCKGLYIFSQFLLNAWWPSRIRLFGFSVVGKNKLVPALDPTGTPCMFDTVTKKPFYNSGTGDFIYPTDAAPAVSADIDEKFYAKLTEHGIRRLYHVPKGCTMSKDEYAARNGFKELVEPPMPQEGYWTPEWRETETQLICEWVETEPPIEEGIENE